MTKKASDLIGKYEVRPFPTTRNLVIDTQGLGSQIPKVISYYKFNITKALKLREQIKNERGMQVSITGWLIKCIAQAISEEKEIAAFRKGKKIIIFDDVDVAMMIDVEDHPMIYTFRKADKKSLAEILAEMEATKLKRDGSWYSDKEMKGALWFARLPRSIRRLFWNHFVKDPFLQKTRMGVVLVASPALRAKMPSWGTPSSVMNFQVTIGSIEQQPCVVDGCLENKEMVYVMTVVNREVADGVVITRFAERLNDLIENAFLLEEMLL
ncbi:MAG TPA: 2-oxo acid dehydrogenase subunit E2 [Candidatus Lokiarchaeia archaeon]|nr:2-oxo acid dehydrogenase subunit E2 [Candidatus Lokiarchaeia archaeon]